MRTIILVAVALLLAGCESDGASFAISGNTQALSVVRHKAYPGAAWELALVVRNDPLCQRKHRMKDVSGNTKVELYQPSPGAWILRQGKRWYVTELKSCGFEQFKEEPQQPGDLVGTFLTRDGKFVFEAEAKAKAQPAAGG
ncbi:MAG: hypothetical protein Q8O25_01480 [Sulfurisoma sp.]|nr:hypothetical protein [Sulfurisoma sp.]